MVKKSLVFIISILFLVAFAGFTLAFDASKPCNQQPEFSTLVCGATPNTVGGYGAVDVCGECHPCGMDDGVCPEDFYSERRASCKNCPDPDCKSDKNTVNITVKTEDGGVVDADVSVIYPETTEYLGETSDGTLDEQPVRSGLIKFKAEYSDYDSTMPEVYVPRGEDKETTILLSEGSCNEDCTGSFEATCKADCQGINNCTYSGYEGIEDNYTSTYIANQCDAKSIGAKIELEQNETHTTYARCCDASENITEERQEVDISSNLEVNGTNSIKHLAHQVMPVRYDGQVYDLVISSWEK